MRSSGRGLHAGEDYQDCVDCHVEHHGRDFDLVFWPDGQVGFDHGVTGFALQQSHARLQCRQCHAARYQTDPGFLREKQKDPRPHLPGPVGHLHRLPCGCSRRAVPR